jgi:hypothetical protein
VLPSRLGVGRAPAGTGRGRLRVRGDADLRWRGAPGSCACWPAGAGSLQPGTEECAWPTARTGSSLADCAVHALGEERTEEPWLLLAGSLGLWCWPLGAGSLGGGLLICAHCGAGAWDAGSLGGAGLEPGGRRRRRSARRPPGS